MRRYLKLKSIAMLLAMLTGLVPPLAVTEAAQAQQRVSQAQRNAARGRVQAGRQHVNRPAAHRPRNTVHHRPVHRPHTVHRRSNNIVVVHPRRTWHPGGAIAAGAAIGFVAGAAASSWAGPPPRANYCWFYTNHARTHGFWDVCPRW